MTQQQEWKVARWLLKRGKVTLREAPSWIKSLEHDPQRFYAIRVVRRSPDGYPIPSDEDYLFLTDSHRDLIAEEQVRRKRMRLETETVWIARIALVLSALSIAWQIYTWTAETEGSKPAPATSSSQVGDL